MDIKISYKQLEPTPALTDLTKRKSERLKKYFNGKMNLQWIFNVERHNHIAHCHVVGDHMEFFSEAVSDSLYSSVDQALDHVEKRLPTINPLSVLNFHFTAR